jgi:hypothetical protein
MQYGECWMAKATDAHSEYVITYCFHTVTVVTRTLSNITLYVHFLSCSVITAWLL